MNKTYLSLLALASVAMLTACGGGSDGNGTNSTQPTQATGEGLYANGSNVALVEANGTVLAITPNNGFVEGSVKASGTTLTGTGTSITTGGAVAISGEFVTGSSLTVSIGSDTGLALKYDTAYDVALSVPTGLHTGSNLKTGAGATVNVAANGGVSGTLVNADNTTCAISGTIASTGKAYETVSFTYGTGCGSLTSTTDTGAVIALGNGYVLVTSSDVVGFN